MTTSNALATWTRRALGDGSKQGSGPSLHSLAGYTAAPRDARALVLADFRAGLLGGTAARNGAPRSDPALLRHLALVVRCVDEAARDRAADTISDEIAALPAVCTPRL